MNRALGLAGLTTILAAASAGCTGGYITRQDGSQWTPATPAGLVTISNNAGSYQVWADVSANDTFFSFDPGAATQHVGNFTVNNAVQIPNGTYNFTVADTHVWQAQNVAINNTGACPYSDYWNGQNTYCQLFHLKLLDCGVKPVAPYPSGNVTMVEMAQLNSGQCGAVNCPNHVTNVAGAFLVNPVVTEVYWGCPAGAPNNCQTAQNTGIWPVMASSTDFWGRLVEYGVGNGSYGGSYTDTPSNVGTYVTDNDVKNALLAELAAGKVKAPYQTLNQQNAVIFVIYLPTTSCAGNNGACYSEGGHHWSFTNGGQHYYVSIIRGSTSASTLDAVATHEVAETATDADPYNPGCGTNTGCGWNEANTPQGEIGDLCNGTDTILGHPAARVSSQARCSCL